jgi:hypothetical protein
VAGTGGYPNGRPSNTPSVAKCEVEGEPGVGVVEGRAEQFAAGFPCGEQGEQVFVAVHDGVARRGTVVLQV